MLHFFAREKVSIHAPRAGRDHRPRCPPTTHRCFNPRAPCGARPARDGTRHPITTFQSTRPVRGATASLRDLPIRRFVSIHAPRAGRDVLQQQTADARKSFNPRAPCGARLQRLSPLQNRRSFNPRAPCGARPRRVLPCAHGGGFNPRAPCGARPVVSILTG